MAKPAEFETNLIMPEVNRKFPIVSIIRLTETNGAAMRAVKALTDDGLFIGISQGLASLTDCANFRGV